MLYSIECECAGSPLNPGQPGCMPLAGRDIIPIFFPYKDSTGAYNGITAGTTLDQTWLEARLNHADDDKRWYIFPKMENLQAPPTEAEKEDIGGIPYKTGEEIKQPITFEHVAEDANPALKAAYDSLSCNDLGVIFITRKGQLNGMSDGAGNLIGIHIQESTLTAQYGAPVKGSVQRIMVSLLIDELEDEANRDYIESSAIAYPTSNWFAHQPLEVLFTEVSQSGQDTVVFDLHGLYGQVNKKKPIEGLVTADFVSSDDGTTSSVYNQTDAANIVVTIVESGTIPGRYTMTLAAPQTVADVLKPAISKTGYHMRVQTVTVAAS